MRICPHCSELFPDDAPFCANDGATLRPILDRQIGRTVGGRYRLISRLGSGGMSTVYLARHVLIDRLMAIKTLRRDLAKDAIQRDRFLREARAVNRINHQNIVEITDFGETDDGVVYLVMEYVPGDNLLKIMTGGPMESARALPIVRQCGQALARAHQMGVIHRDLKPENIILVMREGHADFVKILDFGIAKILDAPSLTGSQQLFGTPGYIAPEYIQSAEIDGRADLYSLGVILYELVTGALPFDYEYPGDLLVKHVTEEPIRPRDRHSRVELPVEGLILRCLRKKPEERFRDAFHFLDELAAVAAATGVSLLPSAPPGPAFSSAPPPESSGRAVIRVADTVVEQRPGEGTIAMGKGPASDPNRSGPHVIVGEPVAPVERPGRGRVTTKDYCRPSIPNPPAVESIATPAAVRDAAPAEHAPAGAAGEPTPFDPERDGLLGVRRWRRRFDAIQAALDDIEMTAPGPPDVAQAMALASRTVEEMESCAASALSHQEELESLDEQARDFRSTFGRALDGVASKLSQARGALEEVASRRSAVRARREGARMKARLGELTEGDADAVLWELAAVEEELRVRAAACDDFEYQVAELRGQLDGRNEEVEASLAHVVHVLDGEMNRLQTMAAAMRQPLDFVEAFIVRRWESVGGTPPGPLA